MSSIGTGYDLSASQFSPDGRVFQAEYAAKAVDNSGSVVAIRGKDGVVFAVEKMVKTALHEDEANKHIWKVDENIGMTSAGLLADARRIAEVARKEASDYRSEHGISIPIKQLATRIGNYAHAYTMYSSVRPFGVNVIIAGYNEIDGAQVYMIDPSGLTYGYFACAAGKASQNAKTEIEKIKFSEMSIKDLINDAAKIIYSVHDQVKDKEFRLELAWVGAPTDGKFQLVPGDVYSAADAAGKAGIAESDSEDEEM